MNIKFTELSLENFRSIDKATLELDKQGIVIVDGINKYENNASSNGSGKSSLFEGIIYALFEETSSGEKDVENRIIGNGFKVKLIFEIDGIKYTIYREGKKNKTSVILYKDNIDISARTKTETNKLIASILGISKSIFLDSIFLSQNVVTNLASLQPTARRERLEILTNTDNIINEFKEKIKLKQKDYEEIKTSLEGEYYNISGQISSSNSQKDKINLKIQEIDQEIEKLKQLGDIKDIELNINGYKTNIIDYEAQIDNLNKEIEEVNQKVIDIRKDNEEIYNKKEELNQIKSELSNKKERLNAGITRDKLGIHLKEENLKDINQELEKIKNSDTCPTCGRKYDNFDNSHIQEVIKEKNNIIDTINQSILDFNISIKDQNKQLEELEQDYNKNELDIKEIEDQLQEINLNISALSKQSIDMNNSIQNYFSLIQNTQKEINNLQAKKERILMTNINSKEEFIKMLEDIDKELVILNNSLSDKQQEINENNYLLESCKHILQLITKDFRTYLLRNSLQYINKLLLDYSNQLFSNNGDVITVSEDDNKLDIKLGNATYESLSGGEKTRVNIALLLAQKSLANMIGNISCNIIILDEILGYCDSTAETKVIDLIIKELETLESIYMVSHKEIPIGYDSIITVEKDETGLSRIKSY